MSGTLTLDLDIEEQMMLLSPEYNIHSTANPGELRNIIQLPDTTISTMANWLEDEEWEI